MLRDRDNLIGLIFVVVAVAVGAVLVRAIVTGERVRLDLPPAVSVVLGILFFAGIIYGMAQSGMFSRWFGRGDGGGRRWPDPQTGGKSLWDRIRGR